MVICEHSPITEYAVAYDLIAKAARAKYYAERHGDVELCQTLVAELRGACAMLAELSGDYPTVVKDSVGCEFKIYHLGYHTTVCLYD